MNAAVAGGLGGVVPPERLSRCWSRGSAISSSATTASGREVVRHLAAGSPLPQDVRLVDYGIRGMHLLYDLLDGYQALVIIDALPGRGRPGEVVVLEVGPADLEGLGGEFDPHGMNPIAVLAGLPALGGQLPPTYVVGAAPENLADGIGLSPTLAAARRAGRHAGP